MYDNPMHHVNMPEMLPGESYIDALVRTTPARERALSGITLRIISERLGQNNEAKIKVLRKYCDFIENMTDEQYDIYKSLYEVKAI